MSKGSKCKGRLARQAGVLIALLAVASSCTTLAAGDVVVIRFDNTSVGAPSVPVNSGTSETMTETSLVTANGGGLTTEAGVTGNGNRAEYPDFDDATTGPRAVVRVINTTATDQLNPGDRTFRYGADVTMDAVSEGAAADNGNNVFQRGLFNDSAQFKLEVDGGKARCRVKGDLGDAIVTSSVTLTPGQAYRLRCFREAEVVTVSARVINADGTMQPAVTNASQGATIGSLTFDVPGTPVSVGGKLNPTGSIAVSASDQFNGTIDNAILNIG